MHLGQLHRDGDGLPKDHERARQWYQQAVDAGSIPALDHLGWLLCAGNEQVRDQARGLELLRQGARAGHVQAMLNLGRFDPDNAEQWWLMAAQQGHPEALRNLKRSKREQDSK